MGKTFMAETFQAYLWEKFHVQQKCTYTFVPKGTCLVAKQFAVVLKTAKVLPIKKLTPYMVY